MVRVRYLFRIIHVENNGELIPYKIYIGIYMESSFAIKNFFISLPGIIGLIGFYIYLNGERKSRLILWERIIVLYSKFSFLMVVFLGIILSGIASYCNNQQFDTFHNLEKRIELA